jgi:hypothetical protein
MWCVLARLEANAPRRLCKRLPKAIVAVEARGVNESQSRTTRSNPDSWRA